MKLLRVLLVFTTVMSRQVFAAQEVTTLSRGLATGLRGLYASTPLRLFVWKRKLSVMWLKVACVFVAPQNFFDRPNLRKQKVRYWNSADTLEISTIPYRLRHGPLRHHIATPECRLTRKEFRPIYMWTGF